MLGLLERFVFPLLMRIMNIKRKKHAHIQAHTPNKVLVLHLLILMLVFILMLMSLLMLEICQPSGQRALEQALTLQSSWFTLLLAGGFLLPAPPLLPSFSICFQGDNENDYFKVTLTPDKYRSSGLNPNMGLRKCWLYRCLLPLVVNTHLFPTPCPQEQSH